MTVFVNIVYRRAFYVSGTILEYNLNFIAYIFLKQPNVVAPK